MAWEIIVARVGIGASDSGVVDLEFEMAEEASAAIWGDCWAIQAERLFTGRGLVAWEDMVEERMYSKRRGDRIWADIVILLGGIGASRGSADLAVRSGVRELVVY